VYRTGTPAESPAASPAVPPVAASPAASARPRRTLSFVDQLVMPVQLLVLAVFALGDAASSRR
jgi:hypothetical protein